MLGNFDLKAFIGHCGMAVPKPKDALLNLRKNKNESPYFGILSEARIKDKTSKRAHTKTQRSLCILYALSVCESLSIAEAWLVMK